MNRKFLLSVVVIFVLSMALGMLIHGMILRGDYAKLPNLMRSEAAAQQLFGLMIVAQILFAAGFSWIYVKGKEARPWLAQGFRYGLAVAVMMTIPMYLIYYVVMPFPSDLVAQQIVFESIAVVILGIVVACLNR